MTYKNTKLILLITTFLSLTSCGSKAPDAQSSIEAPMDLSSAVNLAGDATIIDYNFNNGTQSWTSGITDYPVASQNLQWTSGVRDLPPDIKDGGRGFVLSSQNTSADVFMFMKHHLNSSDGVKPNTKYRVSFNIVLASNARTGCFGMGGAPGESVFLKIGAGTVEPTPVTRDNTVSISIDKGNQRTEGQDATVAGNIANGIPCDRQHPESYTTISRSQTHKHIVQSDQNGSLWIYVGTDSGFEGTTTLYIEKISAVLTPAN